MSSKYTLIYALNSEGAVVHIKDVAPGLECKCICPYCKGKLIAKNQGKINPPHFAHVTGADCVVKFATESSGREEQGSCYVKRHEHRALNPNEPRYFAIEDGEKLVTLTRYNIDEIEATKHKYTCPSCGKEVVLKIDGYGPNEFEHVDENALCDYELFLKRTAVEAFYQAFYRANHFYISIPQYNRCKYCDSCDSYGNQCRCEKQSTFDLREYGFTRCLKYQRIGNSDHQSDLIICREDTLENAVEVEIFTENIDVPLCDSGRSISFAIKDQSQIKNIKKLQKFMKSENLRFSGFKEYAKGVCEPKDTQRFQENPVDCPYCDTKDKTVSCAKPKKSVGYGYGGIQFRGSYACIMPESNEEITCIEAVPIYMLSSISSGNDIWKRFKSTKLSAETGNPDALNALGEYYLCGIVDNVDFDKAYSLLERAEAAGNVEAKCNLALCHRYGLGTPVDELKAFQYYSAAVEAGLFRARYYLAECYLYGIGTATDAVKAFNLFQKTACDKKSLAFEYVKSVWNLAQCYNNGWGTAVDKKKARYWTRIAADELCYSPAKDELYGTDWMEREYKEWVRYMNMECGYLD